MSGFAQSQAPYVRNAFGEMAPRLVRNANGEMIPYELAAEQTRGSAATGFSPPPQPMPYAPGVSSAQPYDARMDPRLFDPNYVPRVFQLKYVDARWLEQLLFPYGALIQRQDNLNSLAVRAPSAMIDTIADLIKQLDVPANTAKTVELTCYLIMAAPQSGGGDSTPPVLKPVIDQLRNVLTYKSYTVVDTIIGRTNAGRELNLSGAATKISDLVPWPSGYQLSIRPGLIGEGKDQVIRLETISFNGAVESVDPNATSSKDAPPVPNLPGGRYLRTQVNISTTLDIKQGQQVVVGKSTVRDHALILVVSAKIQ